jgi:hypothetical protein
MPPSRATEMAQQGFAVTAAKAANGENVHLYGEYYLSRMAPTNTYKIMFTSLHHGQTAMVSPVVPRRRHR